MPRGEGRLSPASRYSLVSSCEHPHQHSYERWCQFRSLDEIAMVRRTSSITKVSASMQLTDRLSLMLRLSMLLCIVFVACHETTDTSNPFTKASSSALTCAAMLQSSQSRRRASAPGSSASAAAALIAICLTSWAKAGESTKRLSAVTAAVRAAGGPQRTSSSGRWASWHESRWYGMGSATSPAFLTPKRCKSMVRTPSIELRSKGAHMARSSARHWLATRTDQTVGGQRALAYVFSRAVA